MNGMNKVVDSGTGKMANVDGVEVGGKTGTANTSDENSVHCWFTAVSYTHLDVYKRQKGDRGFC